MEEINIIKEKYEKDVIKNLNRENFNKIIGLLVNERCEFIEDLVSDYLDLFIMPYEEFKEKYEALNKKYEGRFLDEASEDMNLLEEFYNI